jgi:glycolate oxidase FAD binding subunit
VSGAVWLPAEATDRVSGLTRVNTSATLIRIEEFSPSVTYRIGRLKDQFGISGAVTLDTAASRDLWRDIRDARPLIADANDAVWRVSVRPSAGPSVLDALRPAGVGGYLDWGGGLVWLAGPADAATHAAVENAARLGGGTWTLLRAPDTLRGVVRVVPDEAAPLARITRRVKAAMDPAGVLNPGRLYAGL